MNDFRTISLKLGAAMLLTISAAACSSNEMKENTAKDPGLYDIDSRNNENASLGAKSFPQRQTAVPQPDSIDKTEFHYNSQLSMNEAMGDRLKTTFPELSAAYVALTESNVYAAVKLRSSQAAGVNEPQNQALGSNPDGVGSAGIFGNGQGPLLDWRAQDGLTTELQGRVSAALHRMIPGKANIFVSSNPNFVRRMSYYREHTRLGSSMSGFLNEFNTMAHYAFPANANAANQNTVGGGNR